jgi:hypothetical protein
MIITLLIIIALCLLLGGDTVLELIGMGFKFAMLVGVCAMALMFIFFAAASI